MKKLVIASAVAAAMVSGSAFAETTLYGKVRLYVELATTDNVTDADDKGVSNASSRLGVKGSEDLGNGMSAIYQIEFGTGSDGDGAATSTRIGMAGLKGDFGTVAIGNMWTPSYTLVRGAHDPFNSVGCNLCGSGFPATFRVDDAIAYINSFGDVQVAAALVASNGGNATDVEPDDLAEHMDAAVSLPIGPVTLGVAFADNGVAETSPSAVDVGWSSDDLSVNAMFMMNDIDGADDWLAITASFMGSITAQFEDNGDDNQVSLGYVHKLSKKSSLFAELTSGDLGDDMTNVGIHVNF